MPTPTPTIIQRTNAAERELGGDGKAVLDQGGDVLVAQERVAEAGCVAVEGSLALTVGPADEDALGELSVLHVERLVVAELVVDAP